MKKYVVVYKYWAHVEVYNEEEFKKYVIDSVDKGMSFREDFVAIHVYECDDDGSDAIWDCDFNLSRLKSVHK